MSIMVNSASWKNNNVTFSSFFKHRHRCALPLKSLGKVSTYITKLHNVRHTPESPTSNGQQLDLQCDVMNDSFNRFYNAFTQNIRNKITVKHFGNFNAILLVLPFAELVLLD